MNQIKDILAVKDYSGANWNEPEDDYTQTFYEQNLSQFWRPEDISMQGDLNVWHILSKEVKDAYAQNLLVLTFLDTYQGDIGMPVVARSFDEGWHQRKAVVNYMSAMENAVHAKSYSNIFMTYLKTDEINELFAWGEKNKNLQSIMAKIVGYYEKLDQYNYLRKYQISGVDFSEQEFKEVQYQAMVASVFLETCLFYSGFYYPLYFYGQGKLMQAGEIINLILRDESIHGLYIGRLAIDIYKSFTKEKQDALYLWTIDLLLSLMDDQMQLVEQVYAPVDLVHDVKVFVRYNANKALMNLGFDAYYDYEEVNPVVLNGLNTQTKTMDNFSMKGNGYQKMKSEAVSDADFIFTQEKING